MVYDCREMVLQGLEIRSWAFSMDLGCRVSALATQGFCVAGV